MNVSGYMLVYSVSSLSHNCLGHVSSKRSKEMSTLELILDFHGNIEKCKTCMLTKITRSSFPNVQRITKLHELIHSDLGDFHSTPSLGGMKCYVAFIDNFTRYCQVYLLHVKNEALDSFRIFKNESELHCETLIKRLRSDKGGEYYDRNFFHSTAIIHEVTAPYTPQQNGVIERKIRTLTEMVNAMLSKSDLSEGFCGEAMLTLCYILNRVPNKRNSITPYELWNKRKPNLSHFRVWGCKAIVRVPEPKKRKLGERGIECIFIGYVEHSNAYRFMVIEPNASITVNTVIESRDAILDETRFSSIPKPNSLIPTTMTPSDSQGHGDIVEVRRSNRIRKEMKACRISRITSPITLKNCSTSM